MRNAQMAMGAAHQLGIGEQRAAYGKQQLTVLAKSLQQEFGKGFDTSNLRNMRKFDLAYPIQDAVRPELSWTHYRRLIRIGDWYAQEAISHSWSARALDRQVSVLYYERLLASKERQSVEQEAAEHTLPLAESAKDHLRDPCVLDFLSMCCSCWLRGWQ